MSLRLRLALWYGALTGLIILLVALYAYALHSRTQYDTLDRSLEGAVEHVAAMSDDPAAMLGSPVLPNVVVQIYENEALVASSPNATGSPTMLPEAIRATPAGPPYDTLARFALPFTTVQAGEGTFGLTRDSAGNRWRFYVLPHDHGDFVASASLEGIDRSVDTLLRLVPLFALIGAAVTSGTGYLLARQALRPVAALTETAGAIARSQDLDRRVPLGERRDELGQLAATFNEMLDSLEKAGHAQQRFVSDASHELRAPLTAIQANLELVERQPHMSIEEQREAIAEASREARRLARLVADLLALARADAGIPLQHRIIELDRVALDALQDARHLARGQRLTLGRFEPVQVSGDADRLKQLMLILLDNALKYTPASGEVVVEIGREGNVAYLRVADSGVGIAPDALPHVFDRFYRGDPARSRDPGGTGLGLAIARWIVEQHNGEIRLSSAPAKGTTIEVRLAIAS